MKSKSKLRQGLERVLASGVILAGSLIGSANANPGYLTIENSLNGTSPMVEFIRNDEFFSGATDGYDTHDASNLTAPSPSADIYSAISGHDLSTDVRPDDSNAPYDIRLSFTGTLSDANNSLTFNFPYADFGDYEFNGQPILFQSDRLPYGPVVDIRRAMNATSDANNVNIPLINGEVGNYGTGTLEIGTRLLADLNDSTYVDFKDHAILANDFGKPQGQYVADICGLNGIPDGYVDNYDLAAFCEDWLKSLE